MASFWRRYGAIILALAAIAAISIGGLYARGRPLDIHIFRQINTGAASAPLDVLGQVGYVLGAFWFSLALFIGLFFAGYRRFALSSLGAIAAGALLVLLIKYLTNQPRPWQELEGVRVVGIRSRGYGFPSGHAEQAFLTAFLLASYFSFRAYVRAGLYALAALIALSRVYVGEHLPVDVVAGALIGLSFGVLWVHSSLWPPAPRGP